MDDILSKAQVEGFERLARRAPNMRLLLASHEELRRRWGMVLAMPVGSSLRHAADDCWVGTFSTEVGWARHTEATPEAAIEATLVAAR